MSRLLFGLAILVDFAALFVDIFIAIDCVQHSETKDKENGTPNRWFRRTKVDADDFLEEAKPLFFLCISPSIAVTIIALVKKRELDIFNSEKAYFEVIEVIENGTLSPSFYLGITGLGILLIGLIMLFVIGIFFDKLFVNEWIGNAIITAAVLSIVIGLPLVPYATLRASDGTVASYLLITITTLPPVISVFVTLAKNLAINH